jgi:hypothetical protein
MCLGIARAEISEDNETGLELFVLVEFVGRGGDESVVSLARDTLVDSDPIDDVLSSLCDRGRLLWAKLAREMNEDLSSLDALC